MLGKCLIQQNASSVSYLGFWHPLEVLCLEQILPPRHLSLETSRLVMEAESFRPTSQGLSGASLSLGLLLDQRVLCVGGDFALQSVLF